MPFTLHCVRHAQGYHNLSHANHALHDPHLTPLGESQCQTLNATFPYHDRVSLILASPLRRTIYTALNTFPVQSASLKILALPTAQEISNVPCDTGSDPTVLQLEMTEKQVPVDLSLVEEGWNSKQGRWSPDSESISARAKEARLHIRDLLSKLHATGDEGDAILMTHGGFLHFFTEDWEDGNKCDGTSWANTEFRSYVFENLEDPDASMVETLESRRRRGKEGTKLLGKEEQGGIYGETMKLWEESGLQNPSKMGITRRDSVGEARL